MSWHNLKSCPECDRDKLLKSPGATREQLHAAGIWVDKQGNRVVVRQMSDNYLIHLIEFLIRSAQRRAENLGAWYASDPGPQGEMAQLAFEQEAEFWWEGGNAFIDSWQVALAEYHIWEHVAREIERRKLTKYQYLLDDIETALDEMEGNVL